MPDFVVYIYIYIYICAMGYNYRSMNQSISPMLSCLSVLIFSSLTSADEMHEGHYDINMSFE